MENEGERRVHVPDDTTDATGCNQTWNCPWVSHFLESISLLFFNEASLQPRVVSIIFPHFIEEDTEFETLSHFSYDHSVNGKRDLISDPCDPKAKKIPITWDQRPENLTVQQICKQWSLERNKELEEIVSFFQLRLANPITVTTWEVGELWLELSFDT